MNTGLTGSKAVRVATHAPPMPRLSNTKGAKQHKLAPIPASTLANMVCFRFITVHIGYQLLYYKLRTYVRRQSLWQ